MEVLSYYGGSHIRALRELYPELNLKPKKFLRHSGLFHFFVDIERLKLTQFSCSDKREKFFVELAKSRNFDPLDVEKWYSIKKKDIMNIV
jgi:8-oxo-dGTP pyrophosphatase MutT (NUDIX family)